MKLEVGENNFEFLQVPLEFEAGSYKNVFSNKNNKTVSETLEHKRYAKLSKLIEASYLSSIEKPLGLFLSELKSSGDDFYKRFLNKYGDMEYSIFRISTSELLNCKGIYAYLAGDKLKYIGRCKDSMRKRINQGYGKIHPKNCYLDGQATNCHLNARITTENDNISLWLHKMDSETEIEILERNLIRSYNPEWNIQRG